MYIIYIVHMNFEINGRIQIILDRARLEDAGRNRVGDANQVSVFVLLY